METGVVIQQRRAKGNTAWLFVLSLLWPLMGFFIALRNFKYTNYRGFILFFIFFFGFSIIISREGLDGYSHMMKFEDMTLKADNEYLNIIAQYFKRSREYLDIYAPFTSYLISRVTDDHRWLFGFHAFVFGYFYLKTFSAVYDQFNYTPKNINHKFFLFFAACIICVNHVHFVRYWTAAWIFIYFIFMGLTTGERKYYFLSLLSYFVHYSFLLPCAMAIGFSFAGRRNTIYYIILAVSFILPKLLYQYLTQFSSIGGEGLEHKIASYGNEDYIEFRNASRNASAWFVTFRYIACNYFITLATLFIYYSKKFPKDKAQEFIYSFLILLLAFINFGSEFESLGGRFQKIFYVFALLFIYRAFCLASFKKRHVLTTIGIPVLVVWGLVEFRSLTELTNPLFVIGNPFLSYFIPTDVTLYDIIF